MRTQQGSIRYDKERHAWYGRWWEDQIRCRICKKPEVSHPADHAFDAVSARVQKEVKLADKDSRYRYKSDCQDLLEEKMRAVKSGADARSTATIEQFWNSADFQDYLARELKPSTANGYVKLWKKHLKPRIGDMALRDSGAEKSTKLLGQLAEHGLSTNSIKHAKFLLATIYKVARSRGWLHGVSFDGLKSPVVGAAIPKKKQNGQSVKRPKKVQPTPLDTVLDVLDSLDGHPKARAAVALCYFGGLRPGETRGVKWEDLEVIPLFDDSRQQVVGEEWQLTPRASVWRKHETEPKTADSIAPVPVVEPLRSILMELRTADGNPPSGYILRGYRDPNKPLNLDFLSRQLIAPTLLAKGITWRGGFYPQRHGISTKIKATTGDTLAASGMLRHSDVATTERNYIHAVPDNTRRAMQQIERQTLDLIAKRKRQQAVSSANCGANVGQADHNQQHTSA